MPPLLAASSRAAVVVPALAAAAHRVGCHVLKLLGVHGQPDGELGDHHRRQRHLNKRGGGAGGDVQGLVRSLLSAGCTGQQLPWQAGSAGRCKRRVGMWSVHGAREYKELSGVLGWRQPRMVTRGHGARSARPPCAPLTWPPPARR